MTHVSAEGMSSDHGTQFTSWAFTQRAKDAGLAVSMGSIGDCFGNAVIEALWARMQVEPLNRRRWRTRLACSLSDARGNRRVQRLAPRGLGIR